MELKDKVALITGGGRGIGRAIALAFAHQGASVAVAARTKEQIEKVAQEVQDLGVLSLAVVANVTDKESVLIMVETVIKKFGRIDLLVNNAGGAKSAPLLKTDEALWNEMLAVNLTATYLCTRAVLPGMLERKSGRVINIASTVGKTGGLYISAYSAAKHGVIGFTRCVALEVANQGITVNAICPGFVDTELTIHSIRNISQKTGMEESKALEVLANISPQKRLMTAEEVANVALFLAKPESWGINGQAINICGGTVMS